MNRHQARSRQIVVLVVSCVASLIFISGAATQERSVAVIVNPKNAATNVSSADLRRIFAGEKRSWPGGIPIQLIVRSPGCYERVALLRLLRMSETDYKQYWTALVLRGDADAEPLGVPSFGMAKEAVRAFPGAIALVDAQNLRPEMNMKVISVDRLIPGDAGYPVH